ncbi:MutH/Sau3AI family endonuclease [Flavobacterium sp. T12S277]|uniref:MutH/Sau3AI family endonuclease n=1 Tax=Flavobacterium sp. T12S277 TaxID=3402752 RepID=UPI003AE3EA70
MEDFESVDNLKEFYRNFENCTLRDLHDYVSATYPEIILTPNKGIAGQVLEAIIGNAPNSNPQADVRGINVELKVLPLREISQKIQPKERSKIKSLNYNTITSEQWTTSEVRKKMEKMLFLLYEHPTGKTYLDWEEFIFKGTLLYEIEHENENLVQEDWEQIKLKVVDEIAESISEGDGKILGACTSGSGKLIPYGKDKLAKAKQRSYSLKHSYMKFFYEEKTQKQKYASLNLVAEIIPQDYVLNKLNHELRGKNLEAVVKKYKVDFSPKAKSSFRLLINRVLNVADNKKILELEENGIEIKTVPVDPEKKPWEAMSFPKFSLVDLIVEKWDIDEDEEEGEAVFKNIISNGFIFITIIKEKEKYLKDGKIKKRYKDWKTWTIGESVYWKASDAELSTIEKEWKEAQEIVKNGVQVKTVKHGSKQRQENNLLKSSNTEIIHIRPHAQNSKHIDLPFYQFTGNRISISWQSFWLNKSFIESKINT